MVLQQTSVHCSTEHDHMSSMTIGVTSSRMGPSIRRSDADGRLLQILSVCLGGSASMKIQMPSTEVLECRHDEPVISLRCLTDPLS